MKKDIRKCLCDESQCAKCLMVNCEDDNCLVHTLRVKNKYRKIKITYIQSGTPNEEQVNKAFDILFNAVAENSKEDSRQTL